MICNGFNKSTNSTRVCPNPEFLLFLSSMQVQSSQLRAFSELMFSLRKNATQLQKSLKPLSKKLDRLFTYHDGKTFNEKESEINFLPEAILMKEAIDLISYITKTIESFVSFVGDHIAYPGLLREQGDQLSETVKSFSSEASKVAQDFMQLSKHCRSSLGANLVDIVTALARKLLNHTAMVNDPVENPYSCQERSGSQPNPYTITKFKSLEIVLDNFVKNTQYGRDSSSNPKTLFSNLIQDFASFRSFAGEDYSLNEKPIVFREFFQAATAVKNKLAQLWLNFNTNLIRLTNYEAGIDSETVDDLAQIISYPEIIRDRQLSLTDLNNLHTHASSLVPEISTVDLNNNYDWNLNNPECIKYILGHIS